MYGLPTTTIAKTTLTSASDTVTLDIDTSALSFSGGENDDPRHLIIRMNPRSTATTGGVYMRFNGDTGNNYNYGDIYGADTTAEFEFREDQARFWVGMAVNDTGEYSVGEWIVPDAFSTRGHKTLLGVGSRDHGNYGIQVIVGRWANTAALTSVTFWGDGTNFDTNSYFELAVVDESYSIYESINTGAANFDKSSISAGDGDLVIVGSLKSAEATVEELSVSLNNDNTESNYWRQRLNGHQNEIAAYANAVDLMGHTAGTANGHAEAFGGFVGFIPQYSDTTNNGDRQILGIAGAHVSDDSSGHDDKHEIALTSLRWDNTNAVTQVTVHGRNTANFVADSMVSIYKVPKGLITRTEITTDTSSISFDVGDSYDHLELTGYIRTDRSASSDGLIMSLTPHGGSSDTTDSNYSSQELEGVGSTDTASSSTSDRTVATISGNGTANLFGAFSMFIPNYRLTDRHKASLSFSGEGDSSASGSYVRSNRWANTAEIHSIVLTPNTGSNFKAGTIVELRGVNATVVAPTSDVEKINSIAQSSVEKINGIAAGSIEKLNAVEF